jgi:hypothetical protein
VARGRARPHLTSDGFDSPINPVPLALGVTLLVLSGFFSMAETSMMACNRYRMKAAAQAGSRGAQYALDLLAQTDKLLGVILLFNNLVNAAAATLVTGVITIKLFGEGVGSRSASGHAAGHLPDTGVFGNHAQGGRRHTRTRSPADRRVCPHAAAEGLLSSRLVR